MAYRRVWMGMDTSLMISLMSIEYRGGKQMEFCSWKCLVLVKEILFTVY